MASSANFVIIFSLKSISIFRSSSSLFSLSYLCSASAYCNSLFVLIKQNSIFNTSNPSKHNNSSSFTFLFFLFPLCLFFYPWLHIPLCKVPFLDLQEVLFLFFYALLLLLDVRKLLPLQLQVLLFVSWSTLASAPFVSRTTYTFDFPITHWFSLEHVSLLSQLKLSSYLRMQSFSFVYLSPRHFSNQKKLINSPNNSFQLICFLLFIFKDNFLNNIIHLSFFQKILLVSFFLCLLFLLHLFLKNLKNKSNQLLFFLFDFVLYLFLFSYKFALHTLLMKNPFFFSFISLFFLTFSQDIILEFSLYSLLKTIKQFLPTTFSILTQNFFPQNQTLSKLFFQQ